ncbi:MAG: NAD(P)/FAD-dependent oxidoreductase [Pseudomonadota bacterium]
MSRSPTRRQILALLGTGAAGLSLTMSRLAAQTRTDGVLDVAVIGAGAAGLTAGFLLNKAGADFRIFEAAPIIGGRARKNDSFADFPIDLGGEWIHTTNRVLDDLSGVSGVADRAIEYRPMTSDVWAGGKRHRQNRYARGWRGEHRFISTTWFDFFKDYMAEDITDRIALNAPVAEIDYTADPIRLTLRDGREIQARHVIYTAPLNVLKDGDIRFTPDLPRDKLRALKGATMPDGFKLFMRMSEKFYPDLVLFDHGFDTPVAEVIFYDVALDKPTGQNVLGMFGHGEVATPYTSLSEEEHLRAALALLDQIYDGAASRAYQGHVLQNWSREPFHRGTYSFYHGADPADVGAPIDGRIHFAGEAYNQRSDGEWGYMHVASRSAYDAVEAIADA